MKHYEKWRKNKNYLGSSETICETSNKNIWWFIGFVEGDGSFIVSKDRIFFIINQKDPKVLYKIRDILGIGKVSKYNNYYRYILTKKDHILFLIYIFNGRLILNKTNERLLSWLSLALYCDINYIYNDYKSFTLDNAWLSGFIEAKGCFNARVVNTNNNSKSLGIRLRFIVDQKSEDKILIKIKDSFNCGFIEDRNDLVGMSRFVLDSNKDQIVIIKYLDTYKLKGIKNISYIKFKRLWNKLELKQHINIVSLKVKKRILNLVKTINKLDEEIVHK